MGMMPFRTLMMTRNRRNPEVPSQILPQAKDAFFRMIRLAAHKIFRGMVATGADATRLWTARVTVLVLIGARPTVVSTDPVQAARVLDRAAAMPRMNSRAW